MRNVLSLALSLGLLVGVATIAAPAPDEAVLLVANKAGNSLYVVDASSYEVVDSLPTGDRPHEVAAGPDGARAYVTNYGEGTISVVNVEAGREIDRWTLSAIRRPHGIAVGPNGERVYLTAEDSQAVLELDSRSGSVLRTFETGQQTTHMLALDQTAGTLFATSIGSGTASKIDLGRGRVVGHTLTGAGAEDVAIRNGEVWVTNRGEDTVSIVDVGSAHVRDALRVDGFPIALRFRPPGDTRSSPLHGPGRRRFLTRLRVAC